ncbi:MAG: ATP-binding protein [Methanomassiliicoccaceae archaeon]|nr:ATP-binding protein [Methanomassiliicoccaceae archaeon]
MSIIVEKLIKRTVYGNKVSPLIGNPNAKVFMGIRRCGKSTLMRMVANDIKSKDAEANIIYVDLELMSNRHLLNAVSLYDHIKGNLAPGRHNCLFIDEIQDAEEWESVVRSLVKEKCCDIYITGSNSSLLSSEYSTYISGRLNIIRTQPLSLRECMDFRENVAGTRPEASKLLIEYIETGGFPDVWTRLVTKDTAYSMLGDIYAHIVLKDVVQRYKVKNTEVLSKIIEFLCDNIGKNTSPNNIFNKLKAGGDPVSKETVYEYIEYLENAHFVNKVKRYDIKGKKLLESNYKYYFTDIGLKHSLLGYRPGDISDHIENIVYNEMTSRGYKVHIGKIDKGEIDLIGTRMGDKIYVQATYLLSSEETKEREFGNLKAIRDNFPKYVVGMDPVWKSGDHSDGITYRELSEFLMADDW